MSTLPQKEIDHEMANRNEFGCVGLNTFTIAGMIIITVTVVMRMWSRKIAKIPWKSDDYTLVVGLVRPKQFPFNNVAGMAIQVHGELMLSRAT